MQPQGSRTGGSRNRLTPLLPNLPITHFANALLGCAPYNMCLWGKRKCRTVHLRNDRGRPSQFGAGVPWRIRLSAIQWLILSAAALVIAITLGTGYFALQYRERALEVAERELNNSALLLSRHFDQQLRDLQHVQEDVVSGLRADGGPRRRFREEDVDIRARTKCCAPSSRRCRMSAP